MSNTSRSNTSRFALLAAISAGLFHVGQASAAVTVYGGLAYNPSTGTGYSSQSQPMAGYNYGTPNGLAFGPVVASTPSTSYGVGNATAYSNGTAGITVGQRITPAGTTVLTGTGGTSASAAAINASGAVVGSASTSAGTAAVIWAPGSSTPTQLATPTDGSDPSTGAIGNQANSINSSNQSVGTARVYVTLYPGQPYSYVTYFMRAVKWAADGTVTPLPALGNNYAGAPVAQALGINDNGIAIGNSSFYNANGSTAGAHAVRWAADNTITDLGAINTSASGRSASYAYKINNNNVAVGYSTRYDGAYSAGNRAVVWAAGSNTPVELSVPSTFNNGFTNEADTYAFDVNNNGVAVGSASTTSSQATLAVRWDTTTGASTLLGTLGANGRGATAYAAYAINDAGLVVGSGQTYAGSGTNPTNVVAVVWKNDVAYDLNTLLAPNSGWLLTSATGITADGWVSGLGTFTDATGSYTRDFLLQVPASLPGPASLGLLGLVAATALRRVRQS